MVLTRSIQAARRQTATRENREAQNRAELRLEEVLKTQGIVDELDRRDRPRNIQVETAFAVAYQCVDTDDERQAVLAAYMKWDADEKGERKDRREVVNEAATMLVRDNVVWIDSQPVPSEWLHDGCAPSGRAA